MTDIKGEVTAETVLSQCIRMSNDTLYAFFDYFSNTPQISIFVKESDSSIFYSKVYYFDESLTGVTLAEILQDLIKIEIEHTGERNE